MGDLNRVSKKRIVGAYERARTKANHADALATERADELDKLNVPSVSRQQRALNGTPSLPEPRSPMTAIGLEQPGTFMDFQRRQMERDALAAMTPITPEPDTPRSGSGRVFPEPIQETKPVARNNMHSGKYNGVDRAALMQAQKDALAHGTLPNIAKTIGYNTASGATEIAALAADMSRYMPAPDDLMQHRDAQQRQETADRLRNVSDLLYQNALLAQEEAKRDKGAVGSALVDIGTTVGSLAGRAALNAVVPGLGTAALMADVGGGAARGYRQTNENAQGGEYDPAKALLLAGAGMGGVALGGSVSKAADTAAISGLTRLGLQNNIPLNIGAGALSGLGYFAGEAAINEPAKYLVDNSYRPNAGELASRAAGAAIFGAVSRAVNIAVTSQATKDAIETEAERLQRQYEQLRTVLQDPSVSAETKNALGESIIDSAGVLGARVQGLHAVGAQKEIDAALLQLSEMQAEVRDILSVSGYLNAQGYTAPRGTPQAQTRAYSLPPYGAAQAEAGTSPVIFPGEITRRQTPQYQNTAQQEPRQLPAAEETARYKWMGPVPDTDLAYPPLRFSQPPETPATSETKALELGEITEDGLRAEYQALFGDQTPLNDALQKPAENALPETANAGTMQNTGATSGAQTVDQTPSEPLRRTGAEDVVQKEANSPQQRLADQVRRSIDRGIAFNSARLFEMADKAYGGKMSEGAYTVKDAYDGMELAVNQYLMASDTVKNGNGGSAQAKSTLAGLQNLLNRLPTQTKRSEEQESYQQYSTPPTIAYLAAWVANVDRSDTVLEPSAGIGGIALFPKAWGATVYGNELSKRRLAFLDKLGLDRTFNLNAEQIDNLLPDDVSPSVVLMNPPFSSTAGRISKNNTANAKRHIEQALERLQDGGRLVAILGKGMSDDAKAFSGWWDGLRNDYSIAANIQIDGENYKKYGTTWDVQLVVIDKTGPQMGKTITGEYTDLGEIPGILEAVRNGREHSIRRTPDEGMEANAGAQSNTAVTGVQRASGGSGRSKPLSGTGVATGTGGQPSGRGTRTNRVGDHGEHTGRTGDAVPPENGVQDPDNERGPSDGRNVGRGDLKGAGERNGSGGQAGAAAGRGANESGVERVQPGRNVSDTRLKEAAKEAAENTDNIYSTYVPRKAVIRGSKPHPAKLVESAAMAAVEPPAATYTPNLPQDIVEKGVLSDAQLENVIYAGQAHKQKLPDGRRRGYFIGDGTGVGKGRQISGIILDNFRHGRDKALWVSVNKDLIHDAIRDWSALGGSKSDIIDMSKIDPKKKGITADKGILFAGYPTIRSQKEERLKMLQQWFGKDFDGVIAFDEAHKMANSQGKKGSRGKTKPSETALAAIELQRAFPNARVLYVSATGASDVGEYGYLERLGLWGPGTSFTDFNDFAAKIGSGGIAAMELVARDMKAMGEYMARSISYDDVVYDTLQHTLTPVQTEIYDRMGDAWQTVLQNINKALEITGQMKDGKARGTAMSKFFGTQQRFYDQILTSMSMPSVIADMRKELDAGRSVVLQLTNTNEAAQNRAIAKNAEAGGDLENLDLTPSEMLSEMVKSAFPIQSYEEYEDDNGNIRSRPVNDAEGNPVIDRRAVKLRDALLEDLSMMRVPDGPLELLFDAFGVENVAEVTGRSRRVVYKQKPDGGRERTIEKLKESNRAADTAAFQAGKKRILVFSEAGGTGRSYHADLTAKNQQQRVHYLLQPGWNASTAVQGFGRTHRSNQASAPIFKLVTTNVLGQKRFTSTIARRLDQLGALTKGQRQTGSGIFGEKDNLENPIAADALARYYRTVSPSMLKKLGLYEKLYDQYGHFNEKSDTQRDVKTFLNRILSLHVDEQNEVFQGFYDTFERFMDNAIENGTVDMGLENVKADKIEIIDETTVRKDAASGSDTKYVQMQLSRKPVLTQYDELETLHDKFQGLVRLESGSVRAVYEIGSRTNEKTGEIQRRFRLESPIKGKDSTFVESTMQKQTKAIDKKEWRTAWGEEIKKAPEYETSTLHMLTGTLLPIWDRLPPENTRVMRVIASDGTQYLGRVIRTDQIDDVLRGLGAKRTLKTYTGKELIKEVLENGKVAFFRDDRLRVVRSRVSGEWRLEVLGPNAWHLSRQYDAIIRETIDYKPRFFIPTGAKGEAILDRILAYNPVIDMGGSHSVRESRDAKVQPQPEKWSTTRVGDKNKESLPLSDVIGKIRHDFGINITTGHIRKRGVRGQYNETTHGIRQKIANDLPTVAHELGHHFDNVYDLIGSAPSEAVNELVRNLDPEFAAQYKAKELPGEGAAEYMRAFLENSAKAAAKYPEFTEYFKSTISTKDLFLIEELADEINAIYSLDADSAQNEIRHLSEESRDFRSPLEQGRDWVDEVYQAVFDPNYGIKQFSDAVGDRKAYRLATNAAYADCVAYAALNGDVFTPDAVYVGPGLKTALQGIIGNRKKSQDFSEYLVCKHGATWADLGRDVFADPRKNTKEWMVARADALEAKNPEFSDAAKRVYTFIDDFYQTWLVGTGLVSKSTYKKWRETYPYYVPFQRFIPDKSGTGRGVRRTFANQTSPVRRAKGSTLEHIDPIDNLIVNVIQTVNVGLTNNVFAEITWAATKYGADALWLEKIPTELSPMNVRLADIMRILKNDIGNALADGSLDQNAADVVGNLIDALGTSYTQFGVGKPHGDVVTVMRDGKPEFWKVNDRLLLQSVADLKPRQRSAILEAYGKTTRSITAMVTGLNVGWGLFSNAPRDLQTLFHYSKEKNPLNLITGIAASYINKFRKEGTDQLYKEYLAMGGGHDTAYYGDRKVADKIRKKWEGKIELDPVAWLGFAGNVIEDGPRYATYRAARMAGVPAEEAIYLAHNITTDFRNAGRISKDIGLVIPFFSAGVKALDHSVRWIAADDVPTVKRGVASRKRVLMYLAVSVAAGALTYAINNRTDDAKKEYQMLSNYQKNNYWCIPLGNGNYLTIPKARELSVPTSFVETVLERFHGGNTHAFDDFLEYTSNAVLPPIASDLASLPEQGYVKAGSSAMASFGAIGIVGSALANKDFLGRPIVSRGLERLYPRDQWTRRTSKIAKALGQAIDVSPQQVDYIGGQMLGGFWKYQKALLPVGGENIDYWLGIRNTYFKDSLYSTDIVTRLYDAQDAAARAKASHPEDIDAAIQAKRYNNMVSFYGTYYKIAKDEPQTEARRGTRAYVLDMIYEFEKAVEHGEMTGEEEAVLDVCRAANDLEYMPSVMQPSIKDGGGVDHPLSETAYVSYQTNYLGRYYDYVAACLPDAKNQREKEAVCLKAKQAAKEFATNEILREMGAPLTNYAEKYHGAPPEDVIRFKASVDIANDDGSLKQQEVIDILKGMSLADDVYNVLWHSVYSSDKNNPRAK